ncbi:MAG TPA: glycosyltransferase [Candidatus Hydrogenedentes bacterium]|nr:glycosyltransferase [Candidatus Hydrogenedentota bacterium]
MSYRKFVGPSPRVLFLESDYWLDTACIRAAERMGWALRRTPVRMLGVMPREQVRDLLYALGEFRPDFVLSVNLGAMDEAGVFARLFEDLRLPWVTWFVDDPRTIIMDRTCYGGEYAAALTWDAAYEDALHRAGFALVRTLPLAADTAFFDAEPADAWKFPPTFVGNSMIEFAERERVWFVKRPNLAAIIDAVFDAGRVTRESFGRGLDAVLPADCATTLDAEARRHVELCLFVEGTRRLRHALATALVPEGLCLRGDAAWRLHFPDARPTLNYQRELPAYYRACEVNVNCTSIQMPNTVNQRVFDCPAAGGFLLTDAQPALRELFDADTEIACYASLDEAREMLRYFRARPAERRAITARARERILNEHTYEHRLHVIADWMRERFAE